MMGTVLHFQIGWEPLTKLGKVFSQELTVLLLLDLDPLRNMDVA
jgi:hypothetical protein